MDFFFTILGMILGVGAGLWTGGQLGGPAVDVETQFDPDDAAALPGALADARLRAAAAWKDRARCETRLGALFLAAGLAAAALVAASMSTIVTGRAVFFAAMWTVNAAGWTAYFRLRRAAEEKRQAAVEADAVVLQLEALVEPRQ